MPSNKKKAVALDTEMVTVTGSDGKNKQVAGRISLVGGDGRVLLDETCAVPKNSPVVNYNTRWSGLTEDSLQDARPLNDVASDASKLMKVKQCPHCCLA